MRLIPLLSFAASAVVLATASHAQKASVTPFGQGCPGSVPGAKLLAGANENHTVLEGLFFSRTSEVAIEVTQQINSPLIMGFEILTNAQADNTSVQAHIFVADAQGNPQQTPAASGTMLVDQKTDWYRMTLAQPMLYKPGTKIFLSWTDPRVPFSQIIQWPVPKTPKDPKSPSWHRFTSGGPWGTSSTSHSWAYRVLGPSAPVPPAIQTSALPQLGTKLDIELRQALPGSAAGLITGASNSTWASVPLPLDLTPAGAPGCSLLVSFDILEARPTSATGNAAVSLAIPSSSALLGVTLHMQWMVVDAKANGLGLAFTGGATLVLGN